MPVMTVDGKTIEVTEDDSAIARQLARWARGQAHDPAGVLPVMATGRDDSGIADSIAAVRRLAIHYGIQADYPAAIVGLNAVVVTDRREIPADDFFAGMFETALESDEIVVSVRFPRPRQSGYFKLPNPASGYVVVGCFIARFEESTRVAVNGASPCVYRDEQLEARLSDSFSIDALAGYAPDPEEFNEDAFAGIFDAITDIDWRGYAGRFIVLVTDAGARKATDSLSSTGLGAELLRLASQDRDQMSGGGKIAIYILGGIQHGL